jgi:hypothetical protein
MRPPGNKFLPILAVMASLLAALSCRAQTPTLVVSNKWSLNQNSRWDLDAGNLTRGIAINKLSGNILLCSRVSSNHVAVLSGADGADLGVLNCDGSIIAGGTFGLNLVRVADDGVIYAGNLSTSTSANNFKIYRWNSETDALADPPMVVYDNTVSLGLSNVRYGDAMDIRGAGTNTQIIVSSTSANALAVFTTTDGTNFTATEITPGLGNGELGYALTFDGTNNAVYGKSGIASSTLHYARFNLGNKTLSLVTNLTVPTGNNLVGIKAGSSNGVSFLVGVLTTSASASSPHSFNAYTINGSNAVMSLVAGLACPTNNANGNGVASSDVGAGMAVGVDVNSGIVAATLSFVSTLPPGIISEPTDQTNVLAGGSVTFSVGASGNPAPTYQWYFTDANYQATNKVTWAVSTNASLKLTNIALSNAGFYSVVVANNYGSKTSRLATLGVVPSTLSAAAVPIWTKSAGDLFFLSANNTERGLGYNPVNGHLIVASRTPTNGVHVLDAATGAYLHSLDMSAVGTYGTFPINLAGVADDGAVYVANLDTAGTQYTIYRWADDNASTVATVAYGPADPGLGDRPGDTFAVRGAGASTEILAASRNVTTLAFFNTADGQNFTSTVIDVSTEPAGFAGLGLAWGAGNTFWAKSSGLQFRHVGYDLTAGTNGLLQTFAAGQMTDVALAVDPVNNLLASIVPNTSGGVGPRAIPNHIDLYDVSAVLNDATGASEPALLDQDFFQTGNVNANGTGAAVFDVVGGRLFALDTNNGLLAGKVVARLFQAKSGGNLVLSWTGPSKLLYSGNVLGPYSTNAAAASPYTTNTAAAAQFFRLGR